VLDYLTFKLREHMMRVVEKISDYMRKSPNIITINKDIAPEVFNLKHHLLLKLNNLRGVALQTVTQPIILIL
jgi:hypothetical protein